MNGGARTYVGGELELFREARTWKAYVKERLAPFVRGAVLEVGCGLGANTESLADLACARWTCLEPDAALLARARAGPAGASGRHEFLAGTLADLDGGRRFDCILYLDVLEHVADDAGEARRAAALLAPEGTLCVLAPAHQALYSPFDAAIGHHRRYSRASLAAAMPRDLRLEELGYLDCAGLLASAANRVLLRQAAPTPEQIRFWDRRLVPLSRRLDPLFGFSIGKSLLGVWRRSS